MVTYAHPHYILRVNGHFGSTGTNVADRWSAGLRLGIPNIGVTVGQDLTAFLASAKSVIQTFHTDSRTKSGVTCFLDEVTMARVGTNGKYEPTTQLTARYVYPSPVSGTGVAVHPWNTASVISLRTAIPRGIASNGRMYYPTLVMPVTVATGRIGNADVINFVAGAKDLINGLNTAATANLTVETKVIVAGAAGKTGPANTAYVTGIRADDRLDTIERRENQQASVYQTATIP